MGGDEDAPKEGFDTLFKFAIRAVVSIPLLALPLAPQMADARAAPGAGFRIAGASLTEGNSGSRAMVFKVTRTTAEVRATVKYATAPGSAKASSDYLSRSGSLVFLRGVKKKVVRVPIVGDTLDENNEVFKVVLSHAHDASIVVGRARGKILDDDGLPSLSISDAQALEGNSGTHIMQLTVTLAPASGRTVTVDHSQVVNEPTTADSTDFTGDAAGTLTFAAGQTTKILSFTINGDTDYEADEIIREYLQDPVNATVADPNGIATITNDDAFTADACFTSPTGTLVVGGVATNGDTTNGCAPHPDVVPSCQIVFPGGKHEYYTVALSSGTQYTFTLHTPTAPADHLLAVYSAFGTQNEKGCSDLVTTGDEIVQYTPSSSGTYYVYVGAAGGPGTEGSFSLSVASS